MSMGSQVISMDSIYGDSEDVESLFVFEEGYYNK